MSVQAVSWALEAPVTDSIQKFVLVALANYADEFGVCWPSQATLTTHCACSVRKVRQCLKELEAGGYIRRFERRRSNGSRRSDVVLLIGFSARKPLAEADDHPVLPLLDVGAGGAAETTNRHDVPPDNRHAVPGDPARRAGLEPSLEPKETTTARVAPDPWLARCLDAVGSAAVDRAALERSHELLGLWRRDGYDLDADVLPVLRERTATPRGPGQLITSWAYFREPLRKRAEQRKRQAAAACQSAKKKGAPAAPAPPDGQAVLERLAAWINSGRHVPPSAVNNTQRDALLRAGLVTPARLRDLGIS